MKHASIGSRVPNNCKYTELKLYFTVYVYVVLCFVLINHPVFTAIQRFKIFAEDLLSIARHLLHYIAQYYKKGELTRVSFVE